MADVVSGALLIIVIVLLLVTGQTIIFLLRLVAADRRGRRRPMGSATKTVQGDWKTESAAAGVAGEAGGDEEAVEVDEPLSPRDEV